MKIFILEGFNKEALKKFSDFINAYDPKTHLHIVLDSNWGETIVWDFFVDIVNSRPDKFSISVMTAYSAAFVFVTKVKCKVTILEWSISMIHKWGWQVYLRDWHEYHGEYAEFQKKQLKKFTTDTNFLNEEELDLFNKWKDVYLDNVRMDQILLKLWKTYNKEHNYYE